MPSLERHPEAELARLAAGLLEPEARARLADHARGCPRCAERYDRAVPLARALEGGDPWAPAEPDLAYLESRGLERALASAAPARASPLAWLGRLALGLAVAAALVLAVVHLRPRPHADDEWASRGGGAGRTTLRVFCSMPGAPLAELAEGGTCRRSSNLAFAASAPPELRYAVVEVRGRPVVQSSGPLEVRGRPGTEAPLDYTLYLNLDAGESVVAVGFGASPEQARAALYGPVPPGAEQRTLHFAVRP